MVIMVKLSELYACDTFLNSGYPYWLSYGQHVPTRFRKIAKYMMGVEYRRVPDGRAYYAEYDKVWEYYKNTYKEVIERYQFSGYYDLLLHVRRLKQYENNSN